MTSHLRIGIGARLWTSIGLLLVLLVGLAIIAISNVNKVGKNLHEVNDINSVKQRFAINFRGSVHDRAIAIRDVVLAKSDDERETQVALIAKLAKAYAENEAKMTDMTSGPSGASNVEKDILLEIAAVQSKTNPLVAQIIDLARTGKADQAETILLSDAQPGFVAWLGPSTSSSIIRRH